MKLLLISSMYPPYVKGGGEISTSHLAESLVKLNVDVTVLTIAEEGQLQNINGVNIIRVPPPNVYWSYNSPTTNKITKLQWHINESYNPFQGNRVLDVIKEIDFDIIQTSVIEDFSPNLWRLLKQISNKKIVHTLRSYYLTCYRGNMFKSGNDCSSQCNFCKASTILKKKNSNYVDHVVGISNNILDNHINLGYFKNASKSIIGNSFEVDNNRYKQSVIKNSLVFGYIGKLDTHKGLELLIDSFLAATRNDSAKLVIAGFGPLENYVKEKANKHLDSIKFIGRVSPDEFYRQIDVTVVPSQWNEPFGRVIIESFAYGKPVIGSDKGGIPEIISPNKTGLLFNNKAQLINNITKFLNCDKKFVVRMNMNCVTESEKYKHLEISNKYKLLYKNLIGK